MDVFGKYIKYKNKYIDLSNRINNHKKNIVITFGTFDMFHIGHYNILQRCKEYGNYLVVGVSSDKLNSIKGKKSVVNEQDRFNKIKSINFVDEVFFEESLELKNDYIHKYNADILIMGDDWRDKFDWVDCKVIYLPRTPEISSSMIKINNNSNNNILLGGGSNNVLDSNIVSQMKEIFDGEIYLPTNGIIGSKINIYSEFIHSCAIIFFQICDLFKLDYYVFAGNAIGLVRNKKNIPWVDDYDIIIFEEHIDLFENKIVPKLNKNGFDCFKQSNTIKNGGYYVLSSFRFDNLNKKRNYFQCDIFYTKIDSKTNYIKNLNNWGQYNSKNIHIDLVKPKKYYYFDNITLPFFKDVNKYIERDYGEVYNTCIISSHSHNKTLKIDSGFEIVYAEFDKIKNNTINNTKLYIDKLMNEDISYNTIEKNNILLSDSRKTNGGLETDTAMKNIMDNSYVKNSLYLLAYIKKNNLKTIKLDIDMLLYACNIKYYFPDVSINTKIDKEYPNIMLFLNWINKVTIKKNVYDYYNDIFYSKKPKFIQIE